MRKFPVSAVGLLIVSVLGCSSAGPSGTEENEVTDSDFQALKDHAPKPLRVVVVEDGSFDDLTAMLILLQRMKLGDVEVTNIIVDGNGVGRCNGSENDARDTTLKMTALAGYNRKSTLKKIPISQCGEETSLSGLGDCAVHREMSFSVLETQCAHLFPNQWRSDAFEHGRIAGNILAHNGVEVDTSALKNISAVDMLKQALRTVSANKPITVLSLGPKTNVAKALRGLEDDMSNGDLAQADLDQILANTTIVNMGGSTKVSPYHFVWQAFGNLSGVSKKGNLYAFASHINADDTNPFGALILNPGLFSPTEVAPCLVEIDGITENVCDAAEWNIFVDPLAAEIINKTPVKSIFYGTLDVTNVVPTVGFYPTLNADTCTLVDPECVPAIVCFAPGTNICEAHCPTLPAQYLNDSMAFFNFFYECTGDAFWWDPLITASVLTNNLVQYQENTITIDQVASSLLTDRGGMTIDPGGDSVMLAVEPSDPAALKSDFEDFLTQSLLIP